MRERLPNGERERESSQGFLYAYAFAIKTYRSTSTEDNAVLSHVYVNTTHGTKSLLRLRGHWIDAFKHYQNGNVASRAAPVYT